MDFGYSSSSPVKLRRKLAGDYAKWREESLTAFELDAQAAIRRRLDPPPKPQIVPDSVRNLVALASDYLDFSNQRGSRSASDKLDAMGGDLAKRLKPVMFDPMEDLLVRIEAIRRYVKLRGKKAKGDLKKLCKDENPEIVDFAKQMRKGLEDGSLLRPPAFDIKGDFSAGE